MLIDRKLPEVLLLSTTCATTPTPNTISTNVPRNSASISRTSSRDISTPRGAPPRSQTRLARRARVYSEAGALYSAGHAVHPRIGPGHHQLARHRLRPRRQHPRVCTKGIHADLSAGRLGRARPG